MVESIEYWENRWNTGKSGWHRDEAHPDLVDNYDVLFRKDTEYVLTGLRFKQVFLGPTRFAACSKICLQNEGQST